MRARATENSVKMKVSGFILAPKFRKVQEKGAREKSDRTYRFASLSRRTTLRCKRNFEILRSERCQEVKHTPIDFEIASDCPSHDQRARTASQTNACEMEI